MSIQQIAQSAGVSPSTISRYFHGNLKVTPQTAQKINQAAKNYQYVPKIAKVKSTLIALLIPNLNNPFYSQLAQEIINAANMQGYTIDVKVSGGTPKAERELVDSVLQSNRYMGLLYTGMNIVNTSLNQLLNSPVASVLINEKMEDPQLSSLNTVTVDNYAGAYQATRYLISLGHQSIALLSGPASLSTSKERLHGYTDALESASIPLDPRLIYSGPYTEEFGSNTFPYLIENDAHPTAVFSSSDIAAVGLLGTAERYGLRIPNDLSVVGYDGIHINQWLKPSLTTLQQPVAAMAQKSIELLKAGDTNQHIQLPVSLIIRNSASQLRAVAD